jgi:hypothetical protein
VALIGSDVSEDRSPSIINVTRLEELGTIIFSQCVLVAIVKANVLPSTPSLVTPDDGGATFLLHIVSYKIHTA